MSETKKELCEAYYSIEDTKMDGARKITIQGKADTPDAAFSLMMKIKTEVDKK